MPFALTCGQCGASFTRSARPRSPNVCCSLDCYWLSMRKPVPIRTCLGCGEQFDPRAGGRKSHLDRGYCNRACYDDARSHTLERWLAEQDGPGCWPWPYGLNKEGYGVTSRGEEGQQLVHRAAWKLLVGPIPDEMTLDHMCHNEDRDCAGGRGCPHRPCANPAHLVVAEGVENTMRGKNVMAANARKDRCDKGHLFTEANTYRRPDTGARGCRACRAEATQRYKRSKRAA